eukprot:1188575-Prorocentrum_minimum.AAC.1
MATGLIEGDRRQAYLPAGRVGAEDGAVVVNHEGGDVDRLGVPPLPQVEHRLEPGEEVMVHILRDQYKVYDTIGETWSQLVTSVTRNSSIALQVEGRKA